MDSLGATSCVFPNFYFIFFLSKTTYITGPSETWPIRDGLMLLTLTWRKSGYYRRVLNSHSARKIRCTVVTTHSSSFEHRFLSFKTLCSSVGFHSRPSDGIIWILIAPQQ